VTGDIPHLIATAHGGPDTAADDPADGSSDHAHNLEAKPRRPPEGGVISVDLVRIFRIVSVLEAASWLLLIVASILKRTADFHAGVTVMGPIHGALFIGYVALVFMTRSQTRWSNGRVVAALAASVVPAAPFFVERAWLRPAEGPTGGLSRGAAR
jgi:integral membrane protein